MFWQAAGLIREGDAARDRHDWAAAAESYRAALSRRPRHAGVWKQYGHMMMETKRPSDALEAYGTADRLKPGIVDTKMHLGYALSALDRKDEARGAFEAALAIDPADYVALREATRLRPRAAHPDRLGFVMLGTTGLCNASCVHCPTGKLATAHVPRTTMPMELFRGLVDEIVALRLPILGQLAFGLFGDGFVDPLVVERVRYARERLPHTAISVNSNGAAFDPARHCALVELNPIIGLHCESIVLFAVVSGRQ